MTGGYSVGDSLYCSVECYRPAQLAHEAALRKDFWQQCPAYYSNGVDMAKAKRPDHLEYVRKWKPDERTGLILIGESGLGKTWSEYALAAELAAQEITCEIWRGRDFGKEAIKRIWLTDDEHLDKWVEHLCGDLGVLMLDDVDKMGLTDVPVGTLFDVADRRGKDEMPLIISLNTHGSVFAAAMDAKQKNGMKIGDAIIRRFRDSCYTVNFDEPDISRAIAPPGTN